MLAIKAPIVVCALALGVVLSGRAANSAAEDAHLYRFAYDQRHNTED